MSLRLHLILPSYRVSQVQLNSSSSFVCPVNWYWIGTSNCADYGFRALVPFLDSLFCLTRFVRFGSNKKGGQRVSLRAHPLIRTTCLDTKYG